MTSVFYQGFTILIGVQQHIASLTSTLLLSVFAKFLYGAFSLKLRHQCSGGREVDVGTRRLGRLASLFLFGVVAFVGCAMFSAYYIFVSFVSNHSETSTQIVKEKHRRHAWT